MSTNAALLAILALGASAGMMIQPVAEPLPSSLEAQPPHIDALRLAKAEAKRKRKAAKVRR